jgi:hypothetical protein
MPQAESNITIERISGSPNAVGATCRQSAKGPFGRRIAADLRRTPVAGWRRLAALEMFVAAAGFAIYGGAVVLSGNASGVDVLLLAAIVL